jgi:hypothetical protein
MNAASPSSWPGSRVLLGWWRELLGRHPQQLWFGRLLIHRVEAPFRVVRTRSLDRWQRALLHLLGTHIPRGGDLASSLADLQVDRQVLAQLIRELTGAGLLLQNGSGLWDLTELGQHALKTGSLAVPSEERRTLYFVDNGALHRPPHFLPLRRPPVPAAVAPSLETASARFEVASLEACIRQNAEWKTRHHFPVDVESVLSPAADWRRVVFDSPEPLALVFIRTAELCVLGFLVRAEGWTLEPEPILALAEGWEEVLPDLVAEPSPEAWRQAWQAWCQPRSLPLAEVEACRLERADHRLLVHAPPRLIERLRAARSDAIKQEAWLLAGDGSTRLAALIDLQPLEAGRSH